MLSPEFLRFLFLALLALILILGAIRFAGGFLGLLGNLLRSLLDISIGLAGLGVVTIFFILLFRIDPMPYIRHFAYLLSFQQNVSFEDAIPIDLESSLNVARIEKVDTDSDGFDEWVVFYTYDRTAQSTGPIEAMVYDNDRGDPPVIFPYKLKPPGQEYLSEGTVSIEMHQVATSADNPDDPLEVVIDGGGTLSIFSFRQNSEDWEFPRDIPPRYQPIGFFRGSGGARLGNNNSVTVINRDGYERNQLVSRSIYELNPATNSYWFRYYEPTDLDRSLAAPVFTTIDFINSSPPANIYGSTYPEHIVMGFYASTCVAGNSTLCSETSALWEPGRFLAEDALTEYNNTNPDYFDLSSFQDTQSLAIKSLAYYPGLETDPDLLPTGGGRDVVTGEQGQLNVVEVSFAVNETPLKTVIFGIRLIGGEWKIIRRLPPADLPQSVTPVRVSTASAN